MGEKRRRSREEILAKRARTTEDAARRPVGLTLTGGLPVSEFPQDVRGLVTAVEELDTRLAARGWIYDDELPALESLRWSRPLDTEGREVVLSLGTLDDDFAPRPREKWKLQVSVFDPEALGAKQWIDLSFDAFWSRVEPLEAGVLEADSA